LFRSGSVTGSPLLKAAHSWGLPGEKEIPPDGPHPAGSLQPPLTARNGHTLNVLGIARISNEHQDALSLVDQEALYRHWLAQHTPLSFTLTMIAGRGSGECVDRQEVLQAAAEVQTGRYDLVLAEDLGRIFRRAHAQLFCELCEDYETRLVAINDHVDTGQEGWRVLAGFASMRHELYNADTARRIRRTLRNRFQQGGVVQTVVYGYVKPPGAKTDADLRKDPAGGPVYAELFLRLEAGASYAEVADWLQEQQVPLLPYARSRRWTCALVSRLVHNPILKGIWVRNRKISRRVNQTGRRKAVAAPAGERLERHGPPWRSSTRPAMTGRSTCWTSATPSTGATARAAVTRARECPRSAPSGRASTSPAASAAAC
jgi:DNA invertase Pin-like site-specific DNA recombinase